MFPMQKHSLPMQVSMTMPIRDCLAQNEVHLTFSPGQPKEPSASEYEEGGRVGVAMFD
ncbi:hypothetical protein IscW_ISCW000506 [Ixodes scapularis]|uniref:Uncharacterized protein n=1 Tax=Ixodes scapularis TaxID=6945 RepID=B7P4B0_IXOSC|nr:hypothetical protein IscW_ISCW000506 [Ixodes scapularis]|eukprot:XP_002405726.1 hypothetical protein IscW_ISCW000506 [Ixodes scapularis]